MQSRMIHGSGSNYLASLSYFLLLYVLDETSPNSTNTERIHAVLNLSSSCMLNIYCLIQGPKSITACNANLLNYSAKKSGMLSPTDFI